MPTKTQLPLFKKKIVIQTSTLRNKKKNKMVIKKVKKVAMKGKMKKRSNGMMKRI
jgi:hypothetical protein